MEMVTARAAVPPPASWETVRGVSSSAVNEKEKVPCWSEEGGSAGLHHWVTPVAAKDMAEAADWAKGGAEDWVTAAAAAVDWG